MPEIRGSKSENEKALPVTPKKPTGTFVCFSGPMKREPPEYPKKERMK
jgi:hypothetical protein